MSPRVVVLLLAFMASAAAWANEKAAPPPKPPEFHYVLVLADRDSVVRYGWPMDRSVHAQVLQRITQGRPKAVVLNYYFGDRRTASGDAALTKALRDSGRTWILVDNAGHPPLPELAVAAHGLGTSNLVNDDAWTNFPAGEIFDPVKQAGSDKYYYNVFMSMVMDLLNIHARPQVVWEPPRKVGAMPEKLLVVGKARLPAHLFPVGLEAEDLDKRLRWPKFSYLQVLSGKANPAAFHDAIVVVGISDHTYSNTSAQQDKHDNYTLSAVETMAYALPDLVAAFFPDKK